MFHADARTLPKAPSGSSRRERSVLAAMEWAFSVEKAELEFDDLAQDGARPGVSGIYVLMQRGALGCEIDGGGKSRPAHDAEVIAAALSSLPARLGGRSMAVYVSNLARVGATPDWRANPSPRCAPRDWRASKHGMFGVTKKIGICVTEHRGKKTVHDVLICPVTYSDTADEIAVQRAGYVAWWDAVNWMRAWCISNAEMFDRLRISDDLPPRQPWRAMYRKAGDV